MQINNPFKLGDRVTAKGGLGRVFVVTSTGYYNDTKRPFINVVAEDDNKVVIREITADEFMVVANKPMQGQAGGLKFDAGKNQWGLLLSGKGMLAAVTGVVKVLMFGAKKYAAHSWREVEDNERRYLDGLMRHYAAIMQDGLQAVDEESGLLHIDHLNCNGLFLGELARKADNAKP